MERHRQQQAAFDDGDSQESHSDDDRRVAHHRRASDTTHDRPRGHGDESDSGSEVEDLPDRFDSHGRPLDRRAASSDRWTSRSGAFRRQPQRPGDWDVRGAWHVGGTNDEAVQRLATGMTDALDGRGSWMNVIGQVIGGAGLTEGQNNAGGSSGVGGSQARLEDERGEGDDEDRRRRRRRRRD